MAHAGGVRGHCWWCTKKRHCACAVLSKSLTPVSSLTSLEQHQQATHSVSKSPFPTSFHPCPRLRCPHVLLQCVLELLESANPSRTAPVPDNANARTNLDPSPSQALQTHLWACTAHTLGTCIPGWASQATQCC